MIEGGILAIWNDCVPGYEDAYEAWYQGEHLSERLQIPGFLRGRRYEAMDATSPRFFTYYETETPDVLGTSAYRDRIDNPTPLTAHIMSTILIKMNRTICRVTEKVGRMRGSVAVTIKLAPPAPLDELLAGWMDDPAIARAELWQAVEEANLPSSREEALRGGDDKIESCLFIETLREHTAQRVSDDLGKRLTGRVQATGIYRLLGELSEDVST